MPTVEEDQQEAGIPERAVNALTAASWRAAERGYPLVLAKNGYLVRIEGSRVTRLKQLPARKKVTVRIKTRSYE